MTPWRDWSRSALAPGAAVAAVRAVQARWVLAGRGLALLLLLTGGLGGCASLWPAPAPAPAYFTLQAAPQSPLQNAIAGASPSALPSAAPRVWAPVLVVHTPRAAPGFDSARIIYTRQAHRLEYFARSEWVDAPARMLAPLMVAALDASGGFSAVVLAPSVAVGHLQLDTQLLRLQQEFDLPPSRVRFALRAQLIDIRSQRVLATRDFEHSVPSASEDAAGGVAAAQLAVLAVLADMVSWCQTVTAEMPRSLPVPQSRLVPKALTPSLF